MDSVRILDINKRNEVNADVLSIQTNSHKI